MVPLIDTDPEIVEVSVSKMGAGPSAPQAFVEVDVPKVVVEISK